MSRVVWPALIGLLLTAACTDDDPDGTPDPDAATAPDGTTGPDAADAIDDRLPWGTPTLLPAASNDRRNRDASLSPDGLELYFTAYFEDGTGGKEIHRAVRSAVGAPWGTATRVEELHGGGVSNWGSRLSADGRTIYFASDRDGGDDRWLDIYAATRSGPGAPWGAPAPVPALHGDYNEFMASPCDGGARFVLSSQRGDDGGIKLYEVIGDQVRALDELNDPSPLFVDSTPFLSEDCLTLHFASERNGGRFQIYVARRDAANQPFGQPEWLDLGFGTDELTSPWVSADRRHLLVTRWTGSRSVADVYEAFR